MIRNYTILFSAKNTDGKKIVGRVNLITTVENIQSDMLSLCSDKNWALKSWDIEETQPVYFNLRSRIVD